jgi:hypothetical protein
MTQDNNAQVIAIDDAATLLEMDEDVAHVAQAKTGETVVPLVEAKAINWVNLPTATELRQHIFTIPDIKEEIVEVEEWQAKILVRGMNGEERGNVLMGAMNPNGTPNLKLMYPKMCIACCYHPVTKEKIFNVADVDELNKKAGGVLEKIAMKAAALSGLDQTQAETIRKN